MHAVCHEKVKKLRLDNGWTQEQLARITSLSYRTIQRIERDGRCSLDSKMALSSAFGISFIELSIKIKTVLDRLFVITSVQDGAGNYKSFTTSDLEILPVPRDQIVGKNCVDVFPPEQSNQMLNAITELKNGAKLIEFDYSLTLSAGPQFFKVKIIQTEQDSFLSVITEMGPQKVSEKKLLRSEALLNTLANTLRSGAWEVDLVTNEIHWTQQVFAIYEIDTTLTIAEAILFYAPQYRPIIQQAFEDLSVSGKSYDLELALITARGKRLWVRVIGWAEYHDAKIVKLAGVIQDITHLFSQKMLPSL
jgi:PAS domain-containing protein